MANWTKLKETIANVIKTNGNQEITGQVLQNTLNNIVNAVGKNATFAGIATPTTNPDVPDGPVFYIVSTAGVYPNFGGINLAVGEIAVLHFSNGSWTKRLTNAVSKSRFLSSLALSKGYYFDASKTPKGQLTKYERSKFTPFLYIPTRLCTFKHIWGSSVGSSFVYFDKDFKYIGETHQSSANSYDYDPSTEEIPEGAVYMIVQFQDEAFEILTSELINTGILYQNVTYIQQNETAREQAETLRAEAEVERHQAENIRKQKESERQEAEQERKSSEEVRMQSESERNKAEQARKLAEEERNEAEAERNTAETQRVEAENQRQKDAEDAIASMESAERKATDATIAAQSATENANNATSSANEATANAVAATQNAQSATEATVIATKKANAATTNANIATENATNATNRATELSNKAEKTIAKSEKAASDAASAVGDANKAVETANNANKAATTAATNANTSAENANAAADRANEAQTIISHASDKIATTEKEVVSLGGEATAPDYASLPLLCGQPMILFGKGTPQQSVVPWNWKQYDPVTGDGYDWNGLPSAIGQQYINESATANGRYIAVLQNDGTLKWINF